jgi:RND family efflux transporter MFP subunit
MSSRFKYSALLTAAFLVCLFSCPAWLWGQQGEGGMPPANVAVSPVKSGMIKPQTDFIATVFFQETSATATEVSGLVEQVRFEEGQRVKEGQILVELGSELLRKGLQATLSAYEQALSELEVAQIDLGRKETLFQRKSISEQTYDETRFRVVGLEKRAASLKAQVERLEIELIKKIIRAPFDGVVIDRQVNRGEWLSEGKTVAVIGKDDVIDLVAEVPERYIHYIDLGMKVKAAVGNHEFYGTVTAIVPKGDVATRTLPVKIRTPNEFSLFEGMSARVVLPTGESQKSLLVPRDAVISQFGQTVVFAAMDSTVHMIPVQIIAFDGLNAGVASQDLREGMLVVVGGNERLRDGQAVAYQTPAVR